MTGGARISLFPWTVSLPPAVQSWQDDPLFPYSHGRPKALIDMDGRTMLEHVTAACAGSRYVSGVIIVGLDSSELEGLLVATHSGCAA
jgi:hypothetical protein